MTPLENGTTLPSLTFSRVGGGTLDLPDQLAGSFGVVLVQRGAWCPFCNAQLAGFQRAQEAFAEEGIEVASISVDDEQAASELVEKRRLGFPVGYGADPDVVTGAWGGYVNEASGELRYLQSAGFVLDPEGRILTAVYSSGAIGRLVADDVLGMVKYVKSHAPA